MSTPSLILCDFPATPPDPAWESFSPFILKIDRALKLAKLPYKRRRTGPTDWKKLNPTGQLPVLLVGDEKVPDSTRILHRIEALAPGSLSGGLEGARLAEAWLWEEFADVGLYPFVLATRWADNRYWPQTRERFFKSVPAPLRPVAGSVVRRGIIRSLLGRDFMRSGLDACYERMTTVLDDLDRRAPEEGFWVGLLPSVADLSLFAQLHSLRMPFTEWQASEIGKRTRLSRWLDRVDAATRSG